MKQLSLNSRVDGLTTTYCDIWPCMSLALDLEHLAPKMQLRVHTEY